MPYQVQQLIEGKGFPLCVTKDDPVTKALSLMIEHDYSQLPVILKEDNYAFPEGMITYEGILRGIRNFKAKIEDLKVRDVMVTAPIYGLEDDLFDILDRLKETNAVLVRDNYGPDLVGIVTSYDTTEYFRNRTEDLMRVEDIELMVKDFIKAAYTNADEDLDENKLKEAITKISTNSNKTGTDVENVRAFDDLSLGEYIALLLMKETWPFFDSIFKVQRDFVRELLNGVREIRNALAHFRGDISTEQRDQLKFSSEWLSRCQEEYHDRKEKEKQDRIRELFTKKEIFIEPSLIRDESGQYTINTSDQNGLTDFSVMESVTSGGRYAALADWLQSQPGRIDKIQLTFNQVEEIIGTDLPASARNHRTWWTNDTVGHSHSQQWLEAGWRSTYINLNEGKVSFSRIREREKAYIAFFSKLLEELRRRGDLQVKDVSPDGTSWIVIRTLPRSGGSLGQFVFSFTRNKRFRVELYIDLGDQYQTKAVFDKLYSQREQIEAAAGSIEWERLNDRRASRLAMYHDGHIEAKNHAELRKWATETMVHFYNALAAPAEQAILEVKKG